MQADSCKLSSQVAAAAWPEATTRNGSVCRRRLAGRPRPTWRLAWAVAALLAGAAACRGATAPAPCGGLPSVSGWTSLGPPGETITAIAVTASGLLIGTLHDGVWRYDSCVGGWVASGLAGRVITSITALRPPSQRLLVTATPYQPPSRAPPETISAVVYASDDQGRTWYPHDGGLSAQRGYYGYAMGLAFDSSNANRLYLASVGAVMRSLDGGATWTAAWGDPRNFIVTFWSVAVSTLEAGRVWAGGYGGEFALLGRSDDGGSTWQAVSPSPYPEDVVYAIAPDPAAEARIYVGMASGVHETEDGGATWRWALSLSLPGPVTGLAFLGDTLFAVANLLVPNSVPTTTVLGFYRTRDHGLTWDTLPAPPTVHGAGALAISPDHIAFIGTLSGGVWAVPLQ